MPVETVDAARPLVPRDRRVVVVTLAVAATAWLLLVALSQSPVGTQLHHHGPSAGAVNHAVFMLGWLVMVAAMMLPPSVRFAVTLRRLLGSRRRGGLLVLAGMGAFAGVWLLVGEFFRVGDVGVHALVDTWPWLGDRQHLVTAGALALAGGYQLAPAKLQCLRACRNPVGFVAQAWQGRSPVLDVVQAGVAYGWSCVGCCWALMLLMFAAGLTSLWLMALLAAVMAAERKLRKLEVAVPALGAALVLAALLVAGRVLPPFGAS